MSDNTPVRWVRWATWLSGLASLAIAIVLAPGPAIASPTLKQIQSTAQVRICIWPEYYGVSYRHPANGELKGIDIDLSAAFAKDLGVTPVYIDSSFVTLVANLELGRCDVAMFAVGMLPQRLERLRFTKAYLNSDIYAVTTRSHRSVRSWADIDQPGVAVGVAAGTFMEPVMAKSLKNATLVSVRSPSTREQELEAGRIDVFMTDYPYSRRLLEQSTWAMLITPPGPFHRLPYGYAVKPGDDEWWRTVDAFVARIKSDGRLAAAAARHGLSAIVER